MEAIELIVIGSILSLPLVGAYFLFTSKGENISTDCDEEIWSVIDDDDMPVIINSITNTGFVLFED